MSRTALFASLVALALSAAPSASAQDANRGQQMYMLSCPACHSTNPATTPPPYSQIMLAANNPAELVNAATLYPTDMGFITILFDTKDLADIAAYLGAVASQSATPVQVIEYYNVARDHYFISATPEEIADLDTGVHPGWQRTGLSFNAWTLPAMTASPVCRFYLPPAYGDSHFFSASPDECAQVIAKFPGFFYESPDVFFIALPDLASGMCPAATLPVYRVWDNRADSNHRYTTSTVTRLRMLQAGWIAEGYGPDQVIMCAPQ